MGSLVVLAVFGFAAPAGATHEVDHRFTVYGHVRDGDGRPVEDAKVMVVDTKIGEGATAFTDDEGYYKVTLHLHNQNLGDEIKITAMNESKTITASFDPDDIGTEREVQVNFGAPAPEVTGDDSSMTAWLYGAGGVLLVAVALYWGIVSRKRGKGQGGKGPKKKKH